MKQAFDIYNVFCKLEAFTEETSFRRLKEITEKFPSNIEEAFKEIQTLLNRLLSTKNFEFVKGNFLFSVDKAFSFLYAVKRLISNKTLTTRADELLETTKATIETIREDFNNVTTKFKTDFLSDKPKKI